MSDINEFNVESGQFILREYTETELSKREEDLSYLPTESTVAIELNPKIISALAKLKALGLTEDEAKAIAGIGE
jgi:hypothetical protein